MVEHLEPEPFWAHFTQLTKIARPSRHEEPVIAHVTAWAAERGLRLRSDSTRNLVIDVPATPGREDAPMVVLQGHLDMVCERQPDSPNDPTEGRIELLRDGDWLTADGTTLGADDGVAIAAMMALVEDEQAPHGPLQLLMTVAEEVGLEGANGLDGSLLDGKILVNLDSEEDRKLTVGCAGSTDSWVRAPASRAPLDPSSVALSVTAEGGLGGHSGMQIQLGRANAIKYLGRALREVGAQVPLRLASLDGGKSRNAIPRDATAVIAVAAGDAERVRELLAQSEATIRDEYAKTDPDVSLVAADSEPPADAWTAAATDELLDVVALIPTGPLALSPDFDGLVETSTSLGEAITEGDVLTLHSLTRSSNDAAMPGVLGTLEAAARRAGGEVEFKHNYGGWRPNLDSPALAALRVAYDRSFDDTPIVTAVHAGLETAVIGDKVANLDMISFGPQIESPHSPDERVSIPTVERFWTLLVGFVDELSQPTNGHAR
ncbi:Cytosol non-specific dipeptidase [Baekduia alba]|uniref:beta-Ala-His dipeptidase n=1 Tax=Baekduia alba TaxID=2997333 RepID=UPI0023405616|nr:beta-Ala-His dipeptidase [Baekduia alba]WCB93100.1 Cytosol non-specific dipeptidase [Baekduia alba]